MEGTDGGNSRESVEVEDGKESVEDVESVEKVEDDRGACVFVFITPTYAMERITHLTSPRLYPTRRSIHTPTFMSK